MMLEEIMNYIRNHFATSKFYEGTITIEDGTISLPFITDGRYFEIEGSILNDGIYQAPEEGLNDETFEGRVTLLNPDKQFLSLVTEIETYMSKNSSNPYTSESFGGYSYSKATNSRGMAAGWKDVFADRLNTWRKI